MPRLCQERARAKINLDLRIVGRRADGYHLLDSVVVFAEIADVLRFAPHDGFALSLDGPYAARVPQQNNLIERAVCALADDAGIAPDIAVHLRKNLPLEAGIGGGSADAAAALRGANRLWRTGYDISALEALAGKLGADVPVCLHSQTARMEGIGEVLTALADWPRLPLLLVNPGVAVATPAVFRARTAMTAPLASPRRRHPGEIRERLEALNYLREHGNDLQDAACRISPEIGATLGCLHDLAQAELVRMSGSGATCFAVFADDSALENACAQLRRQRPDWWVMPSPTARARVVRGYA